MEHLCALLKSMMLPWTRNTNKSLYVQYTIYALILRLMWPTFRFANSCECLHVPHIHILCFKCVENITNISVN